MFEQNLQVTQACCMSHVQSASLHWGKKKKSQLLAPSYIADLLLPNEPEPQILGQGSARCS